MTLTRNDVGRAAVCAVALGVDTIEIAIGNVLATVFSAPPYDARPQDLSWLVTSVFVGAVVGATAFGMAAQRFGIRRCLAVALWLLCATSLLAATTPSIGWLGAMRMLSGLSLGAIPPLLIAYLTAVAPARHRGAIVFWVCGFAALAPPIALLAVRSFLASGAQGTAGWRWMLVGAGLLALIAAVLFATIQNEPRKSRKTDADASFRTAVKWRRQWPLGAIYFLVPWANVGFPVLTGPLLLARGYALNEALFFVALSAMGPAIGALFAGLFVDRIPRRLALQLSVVTMLAAFLLFVAADSAAGLMVAVVIFGSGGALLVAALTLYAAEVFPAHVRTAATSVAWSINRVASIIAPLVLFSIVNPATLFTALWPVLVALLLTLASISFLKDEGASRQLLD